MSLRFMRQFSFCALIWFLFSSTVWAFTATDENIGVGQTSAGVPMVDRIISLTSSSDSEKYSFSVNDVAQFVDGAVKTAMADQPIAGAVISIVTTDETVLSKGYGFANAETNLAVDPSVHLFRIASISKTMTATAIMQLVEQGKVSLDANIKDYLSDLPIDDSKGLITVGNLLTHTSGFDDRLLDYYGDVPRFKNLPRSEQFAKILPKQINPPGSLTSYSNIGFTLLGEIIHRVSGLSYAEYLEKNVFLPLGMNSSTPEIRSIPEGKGSAKLEALRKREVKSHKWRNGWFEAQTFPGALPLLEPEGSVSTTATDMALFMRAHLNKGQLGDASLFKKETAERMRRVLFSHMPGINGNAHGFWKKNVAGHDTLQHGGSIHEFKSTMVLFPDVGFGVFISTNMDEGSALNKLPERIARTFFPRDRKRIPELESLVGFEATDVAGVYVSGRRVHSRVGKFFKFLDTTKVMAPSDNDIVVDGIRYEKRDDGVFRDNRYGHPLSFQAGKNGIADRIFLGGNPYGGLERRATLDSPLTFLIPLILVGMASLFVGFRYIVPLFGFRQTRRNDVSTIERNAIMAASVFGIVFIAYSIWVMNFIVSDAGFFYKAFPTPAYAIFISLAWVLVGVATALTALTVRSIVIQTRSVLGTIRLASFSMTFVTLSWALFHWRLFVY